MGTFFVYILKASFCLGGFYLFYRLLLARDTFHRFNRVALLCILLLSLVLPFCQLTTQTYSEVQQTVLSWEQLLMMANFMETSPVAVVGQQATLRWIHVILILYGAGVCFFIGRHLYSIYKLISLIYRSDKEVLPDGTRLVVHKEELAPFSWMRYMVISEKDLTECRQEIVAHEAAHIKKRHSLDLILADCCIFFQWFNPASWLLKQELQNIHEYEADEEVLLQGINAKTYQLLLIKKAVGTRLYSMANSFNHSNLKKRITMMLKERSSPWARMKYLYILPVAAIAVTAFARPEVTSVVEEISAVKVSDLSGLVETNRMEITSAEISTDDIPVLEMRMPPASQPIPMNIPLAVDTVAPVQEQVVFDVVETMPEFIGGYEAMVRYLYENMRYPAAARDAGIQGRVIVQFTVGEDGKVFSPDVVRPVHPELDIEALRLINGMPKWKPGQQRGRNVSVRYTVPIMFNLNSSSDDNTHDAGGRSGDLDNMKPLYIVDGKVVEDLTRIDAEMIASINIIKDENAVAKYGESAKNGVIEVTLKTGFEIDYSEDGDKRRQIVVSDQRDGTGNLSGTITYTSAMKPTKKYPMKVSGQVTDVMGKPIVGAIVSVKGNLMGTITDLSGNFNFYAPEDATLIVAYVDMITVEVKGGTDLKVTLKSE